MKVCVIPARGGSKRIPRKNIKSFYGKPVIAYPIEAALASGLFDAVVVSTDDYEIAEIARSYGAQVPFMRPSALADDFAGTIPVLKHCYDWFAQQEQKIQMLACLYPVNPFVSAQILQQAFERWYSTDFTVCYSACEFPSAPQRGFCLAQDGGLQRLYPEFSETRTQDLPAVYFDAAMFYFYQAQALFYPTENQSYRIQPYFLSREQVHDIDNLADWEMAEKWYQVNQVMQQNDSLDQQETKQASEQNIEESECAKF